MRPLLSTQRPSLRFDLGAPCLLVDLQTWRGEEIITIARHIVRTYPFDLTVRFGPPAD